MISANHIVHLYDSYTDHSDGLGYSLGAVAQAHPLHSLLLDPWAT